MEDIYTSVKKTQVFYQLKDRKFGPSAIVKCKQAIAAILREFQLSCNESISLKYDVYRKCY